MGRSNETFNKKEKEKKKFKKQQDKKAKAEDRKANSSKGKTMEDMMAYLDENGNITSTPPIPGLKKSIAAADILISAPKRDTLPDDGLERGVISYYNTTKGFGFIREAKKGEQLFFHVAQLGYPAKENDNVTFIKEKGPRGWTAINVQNA